jgi:hypothetical protein
MRFQAQLTASDSHQHITHEFSVPEGATRIELDFLYAPHRVERYTNLLTLSLFDPQGERGTGHRGEATQHVVINEYEATPGYLAGPLPPGQWWVMVNTNYIHPGPPVDYEFEVTVKSDEQKGEAKEWRPGKTASRGPGWYRGDFHAHSRHSDASWDVKDLVAWARRMKLDFVSLTDHNTISPLAEMDSYSADDLLTMGGFELTTFYGHAVALGIRKLVEWRVQAGEWTILDIFHEIEKMGGLFIIAHPEAPGDPTCTGCHWEYEDLMPGIAHTVEVWNHDWDDDSNNEDALRLYYRWLNQGYRLHLTGGTDIHGEPKPDWVYGFDVVYAEELSEEAILKAVREGHLYLSAGPEVELRATAAAGQRAMMGDTLPAGDCTVSVRWKGCQEGDIVRLIVDGQLREQLPAVPDGEGLWSLSGLRWCLVEVRG